jgi:hypothetical protein
MESGARPARAFPEWLSPTARKKLSQGPTTVPRSCAKMCSSTITRPVWFHIGASTELSAWMSCRGHHFTSRNARYRLHQGVSASMQAAPIVAGGDGPTSRLRGSTLCAALLSGANTVRWRQRTKYVGKISTSFRWCFPSTFCLQRASEGDVQAVDGVCSHGPYAGVLFLSPFFEPLRRCPDRFDLKQVDTPVLLGAREETPHQALFDIMSNIDGILFHALSTRAHGLL